MNTFYYSDGIVNRLSKNMKTLKDKQKTAMIEIKLFRRKRKKS